MTTLKGAPGAADKSAVQRLAELAAGSVARPPIKPLYQSMLALVTLFCLLLPLIYFAFAGGIVWLLWHYYSDVLPALDKARGIGLLLVWLVPGFVGLVLLCFMLKPLFAPRAKMPQAERLDPHEDVEFFAAVQALCAAIRVRPPSAILLGYDVNAWVQFEHGWRGLFSGRRQLSIGLPLVTGLSARQLAGVLAHEFGHFAQGTGMRCSFIINSVNRWLESRAYHPDEWDERLQRWRENNGDIYTLLVTGMASLCLWLTRLLMRALFQLSFRASRRLSQEMEFDADRYEALVAGSDCFRTTALQLRALAQAFREADQRNALAWREGKLAADFPAAVHARLQHLDAAALRGLAEDIQNDDHTRYWDSHPADQARIANAEQLAAPGMYHDSRPASSLFADFRRLSARVTERYYRDMQLDYSPAQLVAVDDVLSLNQLPAAVAASWKRYANGMLGDMPLLDPAAAERVAWRDLGWQACVDQLRQCAPETVAVWPRLEQRSIRRRDLALWVALLDKDIPFRMPSGAEPDGIALRNEYAQTQAQDHPDLRLLDRTLGLFARRLRHAIDSLSGGERDDAERHWRLLQGMQGLATTMQVQAEQREVIQSFVDNADDDRQVVAAAHALASHHRQQFQSWLEKAGRIQVNATGSLAQQLLARCPRLAGMGADDIGHARALAPLQDAFLHLYRSELAELAVLADAAEGRAGIRPIRLWQPAAEPA